MKIGVRLITLSLALLAFMFVVSNHVSAQAYRGLIIGNLKLEGEAVNSLILDINNVEPGETIRGSFVATHDFQDEDSVVTFFTSALNFKSGETPGTAYHYFNNGEVPLSADLAGWIRFDQQEIVLNGRGDQVEVFFSIDVPLDAEPGGKYASLLLNNTFITEGPNDSTEVEVDAEIGVHVFLTISGEVNRSLELVDLYTTDLDNTRKWLFWNPPVKIIAEFKAVGNTHVEPRGRFYIHKGKDYLQGYTDVFELNAVDEQFAKRQVVLPGETRKFEIVWKEDFDGLNLRDIVLGKFNTTLQYDFVDEDETTSVQTPKSISYWVIPIWLVVLLILVLIAVFYTYARYRWNRYESTKSTQKK